MADLALVTADKLEVVSLPQDQHTLPAGEAITAGAPVVQKNDGKFYNSDANGAAPLNTAPFGIATRTVKAGEALTAVRKGKIDGYDLSGMSVGDTIYVSDTVGKLADAAGTATLRVGFVLAVWGAPLGSNPDKVALIDCSTIGDI
jgi:hypothetical protein